MSTDDQDIAARQPRRGMPHSHCDHTNSRRRGAHRRRHVADRSRHRSSGVTASGTASQHHHHSQTPMPSIHTTTPRDMHAYLDIFQIESRLLGSKAIKNQPVFLLPDTLRLSQFCERITPLSRRNIRSPDIPLASLLLLGLQFTQCRYCTNGHPCQVFTLFSIRLRHRDVHSSMSCGPRRLGEFVSSNTATSRHR
jgi:hypothetical protein